MLRCCDGSSTSSAILLSSWQMTPADTPQPSKQRTGLFTLLFTDVVGSTELKAALGDQPGVALIQAHHAIIRELLLSFPEAQEINTAGDSFLLVFARPSDALRFALQLQGRLRQFNEARPARVEDRVGLHMGEVVIEQREGKRDVHGMQVDTCARVMSLAQAGQILMTRPVFDNARQTLKGEEIDDTAGLEWLNHGRFELKGVNDPVEICEVRAAGTPGSAPPASSEKAHRVELPEGESVLGWRPAVGQPVPGTQWILQEKLGEGGFGEVWLGWHQKLKERRVFKFCFRADRVRSLKREMTLFRLIKERIGDHPNIVRLLEVNFEQSPFYVEEDFVAGQDLARWWKAQGGADRVPLLVKLEIIAQIADALQAAHDAGVIHRDVKPGNILVSGHLDGSVLSPPDINGLGPVGEQTLPQTCPPRITAKLTDFGIGQVISEERLAGVTRAGFTQTMLSSSSSQSGTQLYMAPELLAGKPASTRSDIYSLGIVLYQLLIGDLDQPLTGDWADAIPELLLRDDLKHCLAGKPEERFVGAAQLARSLRAYAERKREHQRRLQLELRAKRKHQVLVVASGISVIGVLLAVALGYGLRQARRNLQTARARLYAAEISRAYYAFEENNLGTALELLERHRPKPGEPDLRGWEWRYLWQRCQSDELRTLGTHSNFVTGLRFCSGGRLLLSSSYDQTVKAWEVETGKVVASLPHQAGVSAIDISRDERWLAAGTRDPGPLRLWDTRNWQQAVVLSSNISVAAVSFSANSQYLASIGQHKIVIWNTLTREPVATFAGNEGGIGSQDICFSPDGELLAYRNSPYCSIWDVKRETKLASIPCTSLTAVAFSPDGKRLVLGSWNKTATVWDVQSRTLIATLTNHTAWVSSLSFSPGGDILATAGADQHIILWNTSNWVELATLKGHLHEIWAVAFSPDGRTLASAGKDDTIRLWRSAAEPETPTTRILPNEAKWIIHSPDGKHSAVVYTDDTLGLCDSGAMAEYARIPPLFPGMKTSAGALSPGAAFVAQCSAERKVHLRDTTSGRQVIELELGDFNAGSLCFSPEGNRLLAVDYDSQRIQLWDLPTKRPLLTLTNDLPPLQGPPVFSTDPHELGTRHAQGVAAVWDLRSRRPKSILSGHRIQTWAIAFSPDGRTIATTGDEGTLKLWHKDTGELRATLRGQLLTLHCVTFSGDGRRVAAGSGDGLIKIWDTQTFQEVATVRGSSGTIGLLAFLPDARTLISATMGHERPQKMGAWQAPLFSEIEPPAAAR